MNCCAALKDVVAYVKVRSAVLHVNNVGIGVLTQDRHKGIHHHLLWILAVILPWKLAVKMQRMSYQVMNSVLIKN